MAFSAGHDLDAERNLDDFLNSSSERLLTDTLMKELNYKLREKNEFQLSAKSNLRIYIIRNIFRKTLLKKVYGTINFNINWTNKFRTPNAKFSVELSKLHSTCLEKTFWEKNIFTKCIFCPILSKHCSNFRQTNFSGAVKTALYNSRRTFWEKEKWRVYICIIFSDFERNI